MSTQMIFVSLPVADLSIAFYEAAGFQINPQFRYNMAACSMHSRDRADPDGHLGGALPMDPAAIPSSDGRAP